MTLTYGLTPVDWLGRIITLLGLVGLVVLVVLEGRAPVRAREPRQVATAPATAIRTTTVRSTGTPPGDGRPCTRWRRTAAAPTASEPAPALP